MTKYFYFLIILLFTFGAVAAQNNSVLKNSVPRIDYGYSIAGSGDIPGHQLLLGMQSNLSNHSLLVVRLGLTMLERTRHFSTLHSVEE